MRGGAELVFDDMFGDMTGSAPGPPAKSVPGPSGGGVGSQQSMSAQMNSILMPFDPRDSMSGEQKPPECPGVDVMAGGGEGAAYGKEFALAWWQGGAIGLAFAAIALIGVGGNALVLWIVAGHKVMRTPTNLFLLNLAVSDVINCVLNFPFVVLYHLYGMHWPFGRIYCHVQQFLGNCVLPAIVFTFMAIALDRCGSHSFTVLDAYIGTAMMFRSIVLFCTVLCRYMAIIYPLRPRMTWRRTFALVGLIWFLSALIACPACFNAETREVAGGRVVCRIRWPELPAWLEWHERDASSTVAPLGAPLPELELNEAPFADFAKPAARRTSTLSTALTSVKSRARSPSRGRRAEPTVGPLPPLGPLLGGGGGGGGGNDDEMNRALCDVAMSLWEQGGAVGDAMGGAAAAASASDRNPIEVAWNLSLLLLNYFVPLAVLLFTYTRVGFVLWKSRVHQPNECHAAIDLEEAHIKAKRKVCSTLLFCALLYCTASRCCHTSICDCTMAE